MLELKNISKTYGIKKDNKVQALNNISLKFSNSGMTFILGKSGSGKSTLLNIIGGLDKYDNGDMLILNKSTKNFNSKDFDNYRNNYIGFVFQEFNIIEDYNVIDNIKLALNLQNKETNEKEIDELLEKLEIKEYKNRKVNELSGGQKQRVAIARALVKKPKIILADEPTGNLDSKTGIEVMNLLKEISKETLVIVVSHDKEFANKYGDRVIELEDGNVIRDTNIINDIDVSDNYKVTKSKLPLKDAIKLGIKSLNKKKIRLSLVIILASLSSVFLLLAYSMLNYDVTDNHLKLLKDNQLDILEIKKYTYTNNLIEDNEKIYLKNQMPIRTNDEKNITNQLNKTGAKGYPVYQISTDNIIKLLDFNIYIQEDLFNGEPEEEKDGYSYPINFIIPQIIESDFSDKLIDNKIIGKFPTNNDEIVISNYVADIIIKYGIHIYDSDKIFYPKNYNELINSNNKYNFGDDNYIKISGIIDYDLSKYHYLKNKYNSKSDDDKKFLKLQYELLNVTENIYNKFYVKNGFIKNLKGNNQILLDSNNVYVFELENGSRLESSQNVITDNVLYYDGFDYKETNKLNENEMLINLSALVDDYLKYVEGLEQYISKYQNKDKLELEKEYLKENYNFDKYIGTTSNLKIYNDCSIYFETLNRVPDKIYENIKIIGITGLKYSTNQDSLYSMDLLKKYIDSNIKINSILVKTNNSKEQLSILNKFPYDSKYATYSMYSEEVENYNRNINDHIKIVIIALIVFLIFSIIFITNFIITNINDCKKNIGILKSLGATNKDIIKIFIVEEIIVCIMIFVLAMINSICMFDYLNKTLMSSMHMVISPFYITFDKSIICFIYISIITLIATIIPLNKIFKMNAIDSINKK